ncbi:alcohol dehydrogenase class IV [Halorubrum alkaliphilum]|uniref:Alcohol dehydrogenase class IV n=1 Tax=Halorubrum alkaliphilum TaxID=261290 RepID=A0A8T4GI75_9EURY|nr:iron-containing alcohol dehydrogenase family protein [Halorubrum alkaliphilum]MBP1923320.1 alcohol dehydrogenase class IV [Halorubrum alkaliphilum]
MSRSTDPAGSRFVFEYDPGELRCGRGRVSDLDAVLDARDCDGALVVTGSNVGANRDVMDPVEAGLGDRPVEVFAETTPEKYLSTGLTAAERVRRGPFDALVAVGGGSSLDVAKVASALGSHADPEAAAERAIETGAVAVADDGDPTPVVAVPTTLAGADLSVIAGVGLSLDPAGVPDHEIPNGSASDRRLMPTALVYDLALFETTPKSVLCASAMNGFDKAVECLYSPHATPITDGTAMRALSLMRSGFETLPEPEMDERKLYGAVTGVVLAQYGISTPGTYRASIIHAFAHGFSHDYDVHQGTVHGIVAPHVLEFVFGAVDGRRKAIAEGLGVGTPAVAGDDGDAADDAVVEAVAGVSDDLGLPSRLREIAGLSRDRLPTIAETIAADGLLDESPVVPTETEIRSVLDAAW